MKATILGIPAPAHKDAPRSSGRYRHTGSPLDIPATSGPDAIREAILEAVRVARLDRSKVGESLDQIELLARAIRGAR